VSLAVAAMWAGLALAYAAPTLPPSFTILAFATGTYLAAAILPRLFHRSRQRHEPSNPVSRTPARIRDAT
jgi:hypothetical protein